MKGKIIFFLLLLLILLINLNKNLLLSKKINLIWRIKLKIVVVVVVVVINKFEKKIITIIKKNYKFDLNGKIKNYKNFEKKAKKKKIKVQGLNWNIPWIWHSR